MNRTVAIRYVRVDAGASTEEQVKRQHSRDKLISVFTEERRNEWRRLRQHLALSAIFAKPRPAWEAPPIYGAFGDAFVQGLCYEGTGSVAWSYKVVLYALRRISLPGHPILSAGLVEPRQRAALSDLLHTLSQSETIVGWVHKLFDKEINNSKVLSFLRKFREVMRGGAVGERLFLPCRVNKGANVAMIVERVSAAFFRFVVVQTDPLMLSYHSTKAGDGTPKLKYRTCLVLDKVPRAQAMDDVFWPAIFCM